MTVYFENPRIALVLIKKNQKPRPARAAMSPIEQDPHIGKELRGYRITAKLGEGGMGTVYRATDLKLERPVALKPLTYDAESKETAKTRFLQEAKAASALDHVNISTIHAVEESEDGQLFIVMALYEGETVWSKMSRGPIPEQEAIDIAIQTLKGLSAAHEKAIVNRDIEAVQSHGDSGRNGKNPRFRRSEAGARHTVNHDGSDSRYRCVHGASQQALGIRWIPRRPRPVGVVFYRMIAGHMPFGGETLTA